MPTSLAGHLLVLTSSPFLHNSSYFEIAQRNSEASVSFRDTLVQEISASIRQCCPRRGTVTVADSTGGLDGWLDLEQEHLAHSTIYLVPESMGPKTTRVTSVVYLPVFCRLGAAVQCSHYTFARTGVTFYNPTVESTRIVAYTNG